MTVRKIEGRRGYAFVVAPAILKPLLLASTRHEWIDGEKIPATGGCVVVVNHITKIDPLTTAHVLYDHGRMPRYLTKSGLFEIPGLGKFLQHAGQIPVQRMTTGAVGAFDAAVEAVNAGECVVIYPEGTITRDPDLWPMRGKSGAARIALATGAPVVPIGHWGAQEILRPYAKMPDVLPRKVVRVKVGDPVPLDDLRAQEVRPATIRTATDRIMAALTELVAQLRGETPPGERFDPRKAGVVEIGNPNKRKKDKG
jgi:1-acyl-sn-glycerol-3-phosphate acyltransferase